MLRFGHDTPRLIRGVAWPLAGALAGLVPALLLWGFTVDDALISVRYAQHLAAGIGWRFNAHGPVTDGVTPLPWPLVLVPIAGAGAITVLLRAKGLGLLASAATSTALGGAIGRTSGPTWSRALVLAVYAISVPAGAYAASGMETPLAALLATLAALCLDAPMAAACLAGCSTAFRPELAPWAVVLASGSALLARGPGWQRALAVLASLGPFTACALVRGVAFGHLAPLAVLAKPSDLAHGLAYAGAAAVVSLAPVLVTAPRALRRSPRAVVLVAAAVAHFAAMALAGGDWMPFARLVVPIIPSLCLAGALVAESVRPSLSWGRPAAALVLGLALDLAFGATIGDARRVLGDRRALIEAARPMLGGMGRVAALDVGWVGAATEADVVDLAGLTDPGIAALPGGHTSKRVDVMLLLGRDPGAIVLYAPSGLGDGGLPGWADVDYGRVVEQRLAHDPVLARHFAPAGWLPLGAGRAGYVVLRALP